jgi:hypothetical protein
MLGKTDDQLKQTGKCKSNTFQKYITLGFLISKTFSGSANIWIENQPCRGTH